MKAAKVGKSHPHLWLGIIWCVLTHKHSDSVHAGFTRGPTSRFEEIFFLPVRQIKMNKGLEAWRGSYHVVRLLFCDLCMETNVKSRLWGHFNKQTVYIRWLIFFWFLYVVSSSHVSKHHSRPVWWVMGMFLQLFSDPPLSTGCRRWHFCRGRMLVDSKRSWNEIYDKLSLSKTYWATQVVIEKTDKRISAGLWYQSYIILRVS